MVVTNGKLMQPGLVRDSSAHAVQKNCATSQVQRKPCSPGTEREAAVEERKKPKQERGVQDRKKKV